MTRLVIRSGPLANREFPLKPGTNHLGRAPGNDLCLEDPSVSSSHCQFVVGDEGVTLIDMNSTNGSFVNRSPIQTSRIKPGDVIQLGALECALVSDAPTATAAPKITARIVKHDAPPPPPPVPASLTPPLPPPVTAAAPAPTGPAICKTHPKLPARHWCPKCQKYFCDLCVVTRPTEGGAARFCRGCGVPCVPLQNEGGGVSQGKGFFGRLPSAFLYPLRGSGVLMLIGATIIFAALRFLSAGCFGVIIQITIWGYMFSFMQSVIHSTAVGDDEMPELPSIGNAWEDILLPFLQLLIIALVSFGPAMLLLYQAMANEQPVMGIAMIPAVIYGCLYFPMAFLAVALLDSIAAVNPLVVVPSILKAPLQYLVTVILLGVVLVMRTQGDTLVDHLFGDSLTSTSMVEFLLMLVVRSLWAFTGLYLLTAAMRILGLLYACNQEKFGWMNR